jgi:hypothetical protein
VAFFDGIETGIGKRIPPRVGFPRETPAIAGLSRVKPPSGGGLWRQTPVIAGLSRHKPGIGADPPARKAQ